MVNAKITIREIHYEQSFANLFPMGMEKCRQMEAPNLAIRFLLKMGDASMTAALGILNLMNERSKGELLCSLVNLYCQEIRSALNVLLQKDELGKNICIGNICMAQDTEGHPVLIGSNIKVDYSGLVKNDTVKQKIGDYASKTVKKTIFGEIDLFQKMAAEGAGFAAEIAAGLAPGEVEKKALLVMSQKENKNRMLHMAEQVLEEKGLCVKLGDFAFAQGLDAKQQDKVAAHDGQERKFELSPALEDELLDAVAGYLKKLTKA